MIICETYGFTPIKFKPVKFEPVKFKPIKFKPVEFKPIKFEPVRPSFLPSRPAKPIKIKTSKKEIKRPPQFTPSSKDVIKALPWFIRGGIEHVIYFQPVTLKDYSWKIKELEKIKSGIGSYSIKYGYKVAKVPFTVSSVFKTRILEELIKNYEKRAKKLISEIIKIGQKLNTYAGQNVVNIEKIAFFYFPPFSSKIMQKYFDYFPEKVYEFYKQIDSALMKQYKEICEEFEKLKKLDKEIEEKIRKEIYPLRDKIVLQAKKLNKLLGAKVIDIAYIYKMTSTKSKPLIEKIVLYKKLKEDLPKTLNIINSKIKEIEKKEKEAELKSEKPQKKLKIIKPAAEIVTEPVEITRKPEAKPVLTKPKIEKKKEVEKLSLLNKPEFLIPFSLLIILLLKKRELNNS